jgi:low molecular weight protein-tyrosine phosphatase
VASILVVCSGNLSRSPFAEGILRRMLSERFGPSAPTVSSVGTIARDGEPATLEAIAVASEHGIDVSSHSARRLTREDLAEADLVLAVSAEHRDEVARLDPQAITKTFTLKELVRLLEDLPDAERGGGREWLAARVAEADAHRRAGFEGNPDDEDVADPLGQPLETYRAVAWELAAWSERLVAALFGATTTAGASPRHVEVERPGAAGSLPAL